MRFSFITPAYNEADYLPRLLDSVEIARHAYRGGSSQIEVIVADNCSSDATATVAAERGCRVVRVEKRRIGAARNGGAAVASGDILCFCDADMRIHPSTFNVIEDTLASTSFFAGATGVTPEKWNLGFAVTYAVLVPVVAFMRMDTGVVFCRREDFQTIGGYGETRRFAEDVDFLFALKKLGKSRGQRLVRATSAKAITSLRKFDEHGQWHYFPLMFRGVMALWRSEKGLEDFADRYWYRPRR